MAAVAACETRPIRTADIERLSELTAMLGSPFSELCAANLYLFRKAHAYHLSLDETPYVQGMTYDGVPHAAPLVPVDDQALFDLSRRTGLALYPMSPREGWTSTYNPDDSDYIFRTADLASYRGARRKAARNMRRRYREDFQPRDEPFTACHLDDALSILDVWLLDVARPLANTDYAACREAFALFEPLGLVGLVTFTSSGDPAGFILASALGDGSAAVHFAKGKRRYPGVFPHLFSRFAEMHGDRFDRLNFEQDLGKPGFRQAKRSHGPSGLLHKHRLSPPALT
ncbi:MAG TPA: phosphatidylglycerol lysyltransferase domain-containing protein [Caulobacteraceae bacterium]|jgi:hypothetical protein|nr:phosphatidylglycerol lysyltransferase domain-containing protein [Caulobacteraceae bacterium]